MSAAGDTLYGGVKTGGTWVSCLIASGPEHIVAETRFRTAPPQQTIEQIGAFFDAHPTERPQVIGVGAFGPIGLNPESEGWGVLANTPKPGWAGARLGPELARRTGSRIVIDTDVNAAALGEWRWGAGAGMADVAYLTVGTGIGVGLIVKHEPVHGLLHPEAGHMRIPRMEDDPFPGSCPFHGDCWEGLAAGSAMEARWGKPAGELDIEHPAWELEAGYLALGIANVITTVSPQRVIAGGGVFEHPGLLNRLKTRLTEIMHGYPDADAFGVGIDDYLVRPKLGKRAGTLGAVVLAARSSG